MDLLWKHSTRCMDVAFRAWASLQQTCRIWHLKPKQMSSHLCVCSINNTKSPKFSSVNWHVFHESGKTAQASLPIDWNSSSPLKQLSGDQPIQKYTIWYHGVQALRYQFWLLSKWSWNKRHASVDGMWLQTDQFPIATQL